MAEPDHTPSLLIDTHAHLDASGFAEDRDEVIRRAVEAGVARTITVGTDIPSSRKAIELAIRYPSLLATVGIHPQECADTTEPDIEVISNLASYARVVAIGEIGLDFHREYAPHARQIEVLEWQLALADTARKPVIIHSRDSDREMVEVLSRWTGNRSHPDRPPGVIHCFSGTCEAAKTYLAMGFYLSLGAYIGYPSSRELREVVSRLPLERLLIETDAPFLPPQNRRGQRNEPAYVTETAQKLAEILDVSTETIAAQTSANACALFGISL